MSDEFFHLLQIVLPIFIVMIAGFCVRKLRILSAEADRSLIGLSVSLLTPALAFDTIIGNPAFDQPANWFIPPLLGFGSVALGIGVARLAGRLTPFADDTRRRTFVFTTSLQNYGYIAIPLTAALFDRETLGVLFAFILGVEFAFWTIALWQLTGVPGRRDLWRSLNPPMIAIPVAILLHGAGAQQWLAGAPHTTFHLLGACAVPMGLLLSGALLADYARPSALHRGGPTIVASLVARIVILPALILIAAKFLPIDPALRAVLVVEAAMPAAIFPIALTRLHNGDVPVALQVVVGTSLVGLITIPLWIHFGMAWIGGSI